jgi:hypothetical protein
MLFPCAKCQRRVAILAYISVVGSRAGVAAQASPHTNMPPPVQSPSDHGGLEIRVQPGGRKKAKEQKHWASSFRLSGLTSVGRRSRVD